MARRGAVLIALVPFCLLCVAVLGPQDAPSAVRITVREAAIRTQPHPQATTVERAHRGERFRVADVSDGWVAIRLASRVPRYVEANAVEAESAADAVSPSWEDAVVNEARQALHRAASEAFDLYADDPIAASELEAVLTDRYMVRLCRTLEVSLTRVGELMSEIGPTDNGR